MISEEPNRLRTPAVRNPILVAVLFSVLVHVGGYGLFQIARKLGLNHLPVPAWLQWVTTEKLPTLLKPRQLPKELEKLQPPVEKMPALTLVEIDPSLAAPEPPKDAKYYSAVNARAANPVIKIESDKPNIEGRQKQVPKLTDTPKPEPAPLKPALPRPEPVPKPQEKKAPSLTESKREQIKTEAAKPRETRPVGDLALAKPSPTPVRDTGKADKKQEAVPQQNAQPLERPRTLAEARKRIASLAGQQMQQEGGVRNLRLEASVDARATPFGAYDLAMVQAIQKQWYDLLEKKLCPSGKVVVEFRLLHTGRIENVRIVENDVGELFGVYCQLAISKPAPYEAWPGDMRRLFGEFRDVRFTFYYN